MSSPAENNNIVPIDLDDEYYWFFCCLFWYDDQIVITDYIIYS